MILAVPVTSCGTMSWFESRCTHPGETIVSVLQSCYHLSRPHFPRLPNVRVELDGAYLFLDLYGSV